MSRSSLRRWAGPAIAGSLALVGSVLPVVATAAAAASPGLVISQVYGGGGNGGAVYTNDYVELFNRGTVPASAAGLSVQYASSTGAWSNAGLPLPAVTVPAGGSFLIQLAPGTTAAAPLPAPDLSAGSPNLSGTTGKVALVTGTAALGCSGTNCTPEQLARIVDLVGYGAANFAEGTAAPATTNSTAALRAGGGCTDTDVNSADFTTGAPQPRNSSTAPTPCAPTGGPAAPVRTCPAALSAVEGEAASTTLSATDADSRVVSATTTASVPGVTLSLVSASSSAGQPATARLDVAAGTAVGRYPVEVTFATGDAQPQTVSCTVVVSVADALTIAEVQGAGAVSPYEDDLVAIRGVVVGDYQADGQFGGFYVQSLQPDADPRTSEGIRVFVGATPVAVGDLVQVVGTVDEFASSSTLYSGSETQLDSRSTVTRLGTAPLPAATAVTLPFAETVAGVEGQERYEGMLVTLTNQDLVATDLFTLGRFGEVSLTTGELLYIPTSAAEAAANDRDRITLDDGLSGQNLPSLPYTIGGDGATLPRAGDRVVDPVTGVLTFAFGEWRVVPAVGTLIDFERSEPRPATPEHVGGDVQVASFNVLNYFVDLTRDNPAARGADTAAELARQQAKLVAAITGLDADVVGLIEIANDDGDALRTLVAALNAAQPGTADDYTAVQAPALNAPTALGGTYGTDAIRQAIIYRASVVRPVGPPPSDPALLFPADPLFPDEPVFDRPPAVQTFRPVGGNHDFTVVVNHFKSKGSTNEQCGTPDPFGGNCDDLRERQAQALVELVEHLRATKNAVLLGDFNSYESERPIQVLEEAGYVSAVADQPREERISYSFDGEFGSLDYAFLSKSLAKQMTGADIWNINSFEAVALDYNDFNQPDLYRPDAFASSDHDPVLVGLALLPGSRGRWTAEQAQAGRG